MRQNLTGISLQFDIGVPATHKLLTKYINGKNLYSLLHVTSDEGGERVNAIEGRTTQIIA